MFFVTGVCVCLPGLGWGSFYGFSRFLWVVSLRGTTLGNIGLGTGFIIPAKLCSFFLVSTIVLEGVL